MTDNHLSTDHASPLQTKAKLRQMERLLCSAFLGLVVTAAFSPLLAEPYFRSLIFFLFIATGIVTGYLVLPLFLSKIALKRSLPFLGGCISIAIIWLLCFSIYSVDQYQFYTNRDGGIGDLPEGLAWIFIMTGILALPVGLITGLFTALLDWFLFRLRQKNNAVDSHIFD